MSGSGLIYAAVLGAWAVYFVSRAVRSGPRESLVPNEGVVLRRRGSQEVPSGSYSMIRPVAEVWAEPVVKDRRADDAVAAEPPPVRISAATARRRRRVLTVLGLTVLLVGTFSSAGVVPGWATGLPGLLLLTYLVELRTQAKRARLPQVVVEDLVVPAPARRHLLRVRHKDSSDFWDPWPSFDPAEPRPGRTSELAEGWEPRPVPLPTYITAAKAAPVVGRRIDIPAGGVWTDPVVAAQGPAEPAPETVVAQATEQVAVAAAPAQPADEAAVGGTPIADDLAAEFEHKRAVND